MRHILNPVYPFFLFCRQTYFYNCRFALEIKEALIFTWCVMVLHDAHFFLVHTAMHYIKPVYRKLHQIHHNCGGDITVFNTAYSEALDVGLCISLFYVMVVLWLNTYGEWNPLYLGFVLFAINNVHMMGHCGCPLFVNVLITRTDTPCYRHRVLHDLMELCTSHGVRNL